MADIKDDNYEDDNCATRFNKNVPGTCSVMQIACTNSNAFVVTVMGHVFSWGSKSSALGRNSQNHMSPTLIEALEKFTIQRIACGSHHVLALTREGTVYSWGKNDYGQLGLLQLRSTHKPTEVRFEENPKILRISADGRISFALGTIRSSSDSMVSFAWGNNRQYRLGLKIGSYNAVSQALPAQEGSSTDGERVVRPSAYTTPAWGHSCDNVEMVTDRRGKVFVYKSHFSHQPAIAGFSEREVAEIIVTNKDLKRRLNMAGNRLREIEQDVYKQDKQDNVLLLDQNHWFQSDAAWEKFQALKSTEETKISRCEKDLKELSRDKERAKKRVAETETAVRTFKQQHRDLRQKLELAEEEYKLQKIIGTDKDKEDCDNRIRQARNELNECERSRKTRFADFQNSQEQLKRLEERIISTQNEKTEAEGLKKLLEKLIRTREKQLVLEFFEKHRQTVVHKLKMMTVNYEGAEYATIESLSKNLERSSLFPFLEASNEHLEQVKHECSKSGPLIACLNEQFDFLYDIIVENIDLRQQRNNASYALVTQLSSQFANVKVTQDNLGEALDNVEAEDYREINQIMKWEFGKEEEQQEEEDVQEQHYREPVFFMPEDIAEIIS